MLLSICLYKSFSFHQAVYDSGFLLDDLPVVSYNVYNVALETCLKHGSVWFTLYKTTEQAVKQDSFVW